MGTGINYTRFWPFPEPCWFCATSRNDEGRIAGVILCHFSSPFEAEFNTAVVDPRCVTKRVLRAVFTALFSRVVRITAQIAPDNTRSLRSVVRMGFKLEGHMRLAYLRALALRDLARDPHRVWIVSTEPD